MSKQKYVYVRDKDGIYRVGFYKPDGEFFVHDQHEDRDEAAVMVAAMNGTLPFPTYSADPNNMVEYMTIRTHIAAMALQGLVSDPEFCDASFASRRAIAYADALIAELNKPR